MIWLQVLASDVCDWLNWLIKFIQEKKDNKKIQNTVHKLKENERRQIICFPVMN